MHKDYLEINKFLPDNKYYINMVRRKINEKAINKQGYKHIHKYCFFCGEDNYSALNCHRILPGEQGGTYHSHNTLTVCASCHAKIHSGNIIIDKKYLQMPATKFKVHYWINNEEFWRDEELGIFNSSVNCHSDLGKSKKINK